VIYILRYKIKINYFLYNPPCSKHMR